MKRVLQIVLIAGVIPMGGCGGAKPAPVEASVKASPVPPPTAEKVPARDVFVTSGPIVVENQVDVASQRDGVVARVLADTGTAVHQGQLLAMLDDRQLLADRDAAQAKVLADEADVKNWDAGVKVLETDADRAEQMWKANLITKQEVEHSRYKLQQAQYDVERERQNLRHAQAMLRSLELELEKTHIAAPFQGVVARRYIRVGQKVAKNDRLFWVTAVSPMRVNFTLPERLLGRVSQGQEVTLTSDALPGQAFKAKIMQISPVVDPSSGTIDVMAELIGFTGGLRPGMTAAVSIGSAP